MQYVYQLEMEELQHRFGGIRLTVMSPQLIRDMSVVEVTSSKINHENRPVENGVNSTKMGVVDSRLRCRTCGHGANGGCVGHNGHVEFPVPLYHVGFKDSVLRLLKHVCYWCSRLLFSPEDPRVLRVLKNQQLPTKQKFLDLTPPSRQYKACPHCAGGQPQYSQTGGAIRINADWSLSAIQACTQAFGESPDVLAVFTRPFTAADAHRILHNMRDEDVRIFGFDPHHSHPSWCIMVNMVIPPPVIRPGITHHEGSKASGQNDMTQRLREILRKREELIQAMKHRLRHRLPCPHYLQTPEQEARVRIEAAEEDEHQDGLEAWLNQAEQERPAKEAESPGKELGGGEARGGAQEVTRASANSRGHGQPSQPAALDPISGYGKVLAPGSEGYRPEQPIVFPVPSPLPALNATQRKRYGETDAQLRDPRSHYGLLALIDSLQEEVAAYIKPDNRKSAQERQPKSLAQRLKGKDGRFRANLLGKRVDQCARTVITPEPYAELDELWIPVETALGLYYPENVTPMNLEALQKRVQRGPGVLDGAHSIIFRRGDKPRQIYLDFFRGDKNLLQLQPGDVVERYLQDGDYVLFNRHPSLHKLSMMCHRVRVHRNRRQEGGSTQKSFSFHTSVTTPYNGDFDGDEMNLHVPQNEAARAEARLLMGVGSNMLTPKSNSPSIGLIQDGITLGFLLTNRDTFLTRPQVMQLMTVVRHLDEPHMQQWKIPMPAILRPRPLWTGKQMLSWLLPRDFYLERSVRGLAAGSSPWQQFEDHRERYVLVREGQLLCGSLCSQNLGRAPGSLIHLLSLDYSMVRTMHFIVDVQRMLLEYNKYKGHTIGMRDFVAPPAVKQRVQAMMAKAFEEVKRFQEHPDYAHLPESQREMHEVRLLGGQLEYAGKQIQEHIPLRTNNMARMVYSGAKGSMVSMTNIMFFVGQQFLQGRRLHPEHKRLVPSEPLEGNNGPEGRGFVTRGYLDGLTLPQVFMCAICARDSLVDTGVRTSVIGYLSRTMERNAEGKTVVADGTVRDTSKRIIQFAYSADSLDGTYLEKVPLLRLLDDRDLLEQAICPEPDPLAVLHDDPLYHPDEWAWQREQHMRATLQVRQQLTRCIALDNPDASLTYALPADPARLLQRHLASIKHGEKHLRRPPLQRCPPARATELLHQCLEHMEKVLCRHASTSAMAFALLTEGSACRLAGRLGLNEREITEYYSQVQRKITRAAVATGEAVGCLAAESIGEPSTQMTLNTFHYAGVSAKNVSLGLPRLRELIRCGKVIRTPSMTLLPRGNLVFEMGISPDDDEAVQDYLREHAVPQIQTVRIADVLKFATVADEPKDAEHNASGASTLHSAHNLLNYQGQDPVEAHRKLGEACLLLIVDRKKLRRINMTFGDMLSTLARSMGGGCYPVPYQKSDNLQAGTVMVRLYVKNLRAACRSLGLSNKQAAKPEAPRLLLGAFVERVILRGLPGFSEVSVVRRSVLVPRGPMQEEGGGGVGTVGIGVGEGRGRAGKRGSLAGDDDDGGVQEQPALERKSTWVLETAGSDLAGLLAQPLPSIDKSTMISNHVYQTFLALGLDAAASVLFREISLVLSFDGTYVDPRHILLIVDSICFTGLLVPMSRDGIKQTEASPLLLASFEKTLDNLFQGCLHGVLDPVSGVSENIMLGRHIPAGTGVVDILHDPNPAYSRHPPGTKENMRLPGPERGLPASNQPVQDKDVEQHTLDQEKHGADQEEDGLESTLTQGLPVPFLPLTHLEVATLPDDDQELTHAQATQTDSNTKPICTPNLRPGPAKAAPDTSYVLDDYAPGATYLLELNRQMWLQYRDPNRFLTAQLAKTSRSLVTAPEPNQHGAMSQEASHRSNLARDSVSGLREDPGFPFFEPLSPPRSHEPTE
jgi:DNA-directed RNA polymerase beta' subunit